MGAAEVASEKYILKWNARIAGNHRKTTTASAFQLQPKFLKTAHSNWSQLYQRQQLSSAHILNLLVKEADLLYVLVVSGFNPP